jgi:hypothetical protein
MMLRNIVIRNLCDVSFYITNGALSMYWFTTTNPFAENKFYHMLVNKLLSHWYERYEIAQIRERDICER